MSSVRAATSHNIPSGLSMVGAAVAFMSLYLAAGALTPLLVTYQQTFGFAPT